MALFPNDIVDTRMIIERIEELESDHMEDDGDMINVGLWDTAERAEYQGLMEIIEEIGEQACRDEVTLIHERYFRDYVKQYYIDAGREYHEVTGRFRREMRHVPMEEMITRAPFKHIDWQAMADEDQSDYQEIGIDGDTYYYEES
jgi:hypothetical protein